MNAKAEINHTLAVRDAMHGPYRCQDVTCCVPVCLECDSRLKPNVETGAWHCKVCGCEDFEQDLPAPTEADEVRWWDAMRAI